MYLRPAAENLEEASGSKAVIETKKNQLISANAPLIHREWLGN